MEYLKNNKGFVLLILGFLALIIYNWEQITSFSETEPLPYSEELITTVNHFESKDTIKVDIEGQVNYPGLYEIELGSRIGDIIAIAGGTTISADLTDINLAQLLEDGMKIEIPRKYEEPLIVDEIIMIVVEVKGEVNSPGIYTLYYQSRVNALIEMADGFTSDADTSTVELARILKDGETIVIPKKENQITTSDDQEPLEEVNKIYVQIIGEIINPGTYLIPDDYTLLELIQYVGGVTVDCDVSKINWDITLCHGAVIHIPSFSDQIEDAEEDGLININTAKLDELMSLPGIGQIIGQRIIDYRALYGDFLAIEDIMLVSGIKDSVYEKIKELITV